MAKTRRRLTDLYMVGKMETFDDGNGEPLTVWIRKLNPMQHDKALRRANAARSRISSAMRDRDSDEFESVRAEAAELSRDDLVAYLVEDLVSRRSPAIEAELAAEDEWAEDNYYEGMLDSWLGEDDLQQTYANDPEDPIAKRVFDEMKRFAEEVDQRLEAEVEDLKETYANRTTDDLREAVLDKFIETRGSFAWLTEFRRCEVWLSVYEDDKRTPYFESRDEVDDLAPEVFGRLSRVYRDLTVEPSEGKG